METRYVYGRLRTHLASIEFCCEVVQLEPQFVEQRAVLGRLHVNGAQPLPLRVQSVAPDPLDVDVQLQRGLWYAVQFIRLEVGRGLQALLHDPAHALPLGDHFFYARLHVLDGLEVPQNIRHVAEIQRVAHVLHGLHRSGVFPVAELQQIDLRANVPSAVKRTYIVFYMRLSVYRNMRISLVFRSLYRLWDVLYII